MAGATVELFKILRESGLLTAAFIIGAAAVFVAILGRIRTVIELSRGRTVTLILFGLSLMTVSVVGHVVQVPQTPVPATKTRAETLLIYDSIFNQQGWCGLWNKLIGDKLVSGNCPQSVNEYAREDVLAQNGTVNVVSGAQIRISSDIQVNYPCCITFATDAATYSGGTVQPWAANDNIGTNLTLRQDSLFTLGFRCDNAWSPF